MFIDASVRDFIHGIKLSLEENEISCFRGILVKDILLELLKSINNLEEVAMTQEELVILDLSFLYSKFH
jgi:hypothetical protein